MKHSQRFEFDLIQHPTRKYEGNRVVSTIPDLLELLSERTGDGWEIVSANGADWAAEGYGSGSTYFVLLRREVTQ